MRHFAQRGKSLIVVLGLSYGRSTIVENLGPQAEQDVNGYMYQRESGFIRSLIHSSHTAMSGGISRAKESVLTVDDFPIEKSGKSFLGSAQSIWMESILETDGGCDFISLTNCSIRFLSPSVTIRTPEFPRFST